LFSHLTYLVLLHYLRNNKPRRQHTGALCVQYNPTAAALSTSFLLNHAPNTPYSWTHWLQDLGSHTAAWVWVLSQKDWRNQAAGSIQAMHITQHWGKMQFSRFSVLPGSAEAQVNWCGTVKCLLIAYLIGNISAKKISKSVNMCPSYTKPNVGHVCETRCTSIRLYMFCLVRYQLYCCSTVLLVIISLSLSSHTQLSYSWSVEAKFHYAS